MSIERAQKAVDYVAKRYSDANVFYKALYDDIKIVDIKVDDDNLQTVIFKLHTTNALKNNVGLVHGGASSTIVCLFSVLSLASDSRYFASDNPTEAELENFIKDIPFSRSADIQILQAVPLDADIFIKCHIISHTKTNAFINVSIANTKGTILVVGIHDMTRNVVNGNEPHSLIGKFNAKL